LSVFQQLKIWLIQLLGLPKDALHIYVGLTVFLIGLALFRWPMSSWKPVGLVLGAALVGEAWDVLDTLRIGADPVWARNWHDVWNTCFWPSVLFLLARYTRVLRR
jgi:hypothetical protein